MVLRLAGIAALGAPVAGRDVDLAAENRIQPARPRMVVEDHRREQVAVLGDGNRRHLQLDRLIEHLVDAARAVEQRVLGVQMEVDEFRHASGSTAQIAFTAELAFVPNSAVLSSIVIPTRSSTAASS